MKKILIENALEAWSIAVKYCRDIKNGLATLHYKKMFVSSLHNAIELFIKQIMIDKNDHAVVKMFKVENEEAAQLQLDYYQSTDLNVFFGKLSEEDRDNLRTIEFNKIIDLSTSLLKPTLISLNKNSIKDELDKLNKLRNNETHFQIAFEEYLSEDDFVSLHNLMVVFYKVLQDFKLLPYWGRRVARFSKHAHLQFNEETINEGDFSYKNAIKQSAISKKIKEVFYSAVIIGLYYDSSFDLAEQYFEEVERNGCDNSYSFNDILAAFTMLEYFGCIKTEEIMLQEAEETSDGQVVPPVIGTKIHINI